GTDQRRRGDVPYLPESAHQLGVGGRRHLRDRHADRRLARPGESAGAGAATGGGRRRGLRATAGHRWNLHWPAAGGLLEMMMAGKKLFKLTMLILLLVLLPAAVYAQDDIVTDDEVNAVAKDVYCPVCESTPLDVCPTQACADWRELIRTKLAEGQSRDEILNYFARQYGDGVLSNPPRRGA